MVIFFLVPKTAFLSDSKHKKTTMNAHFPKAQYIHGSTPKEQARLSKLNVILNEKSLKELDLKGGEKILDIGSGLGQFSSMMAEKVEPTGSVLGIERDIAQYQKALALAHNSPATNIEFRQGNAYQLPLKKAEWKSFDLVHTRFLLEHLSQPQKAVNQMVKATKSGGRIVLEDDDHATFRPTPEPMGFSIIWTAYLRSYERLGNDPFIGRRLVTLLRNSGIKKIRNSSIFFGGCASEKQFPLVAENLIGILEGAKALILKEALLDEPSFKLAIEGLKHWKTLPDAALWYSIAWAEGIKD